MKKTVIQGEILKALKNLLTKKYGTLIKKIILFGSQCSGRATENSDFDFLLILATPFDWKLEKEIINLCYEIDLEFDIVTDIHLISEEDLETIKGKEPFIQNALEKGLAA